MLFADYTRTNTPMNNCTTATRKGKVMRRESAGYDTVFHGVDERILALQEMKKSTSIGVERKVNMILFHHHEDDVDKLLPKATSAEGSRPLPLSGSESAVLGWAKLASASYPTVFKRCGWASSDS
jgi:hypothetical protein